MAAIGFGATLGPRAWRAATAGFDLSTGLPAGATLARASAATRIDASGRVASEAAGVARLDHDPLALTPRGLLIEPAATNLLLASEAFDAAAWTSSGSNVAADAAISPAGTQTADRISETSGTGQHRQVQTVAGTNGQAVTLSIFVKAAERSRVQLRLTGATAFAVTTFNLSAKSWSGSAGSTLVELANGWFRASVAGIADGSSVIAALNLVDQAGVTAYTGSTAAGLLAWGAQLEVGAATSYVETTTVATAGRAADVLSLDWGGKGVADGAVMLRYGFDDGSVQDVAATIAGGSATVPTTTLARARLRRVALV